MSINPFFLDANASAPILPEAKGALWAALEVVGNASSPHVIGRVARTVLDQAREKVAFALGGKDKEVIFTSGASEGNRWLVDAVCKLGKRQGKALRVVCTPFEHPSLMKPLLQAHEEGALNLAVIHVDSSGQMSFGSVADADVAFIVSAHNETGILTDWSSLLPLIKPDTILVTDASQSLARIGAPPARVDAIVASAHKLGGIAGVGVLLLRRNAKKLPAPWSGGGQEGGLRPGTESLALIAAFGAAAELIERSREQHRDLLELRDSIEKKFLAEVAHAQVLGAFVERLPNTSAITLSNVDGEALRMAIDLEGICVGFGSACSGLAPEPSPALLALGLTANQARATIRLSFYPGIDRPRLDESLQSLIRIALLIAR